MAEINLNEVKDFEIDSSKVDILNFGGTELWRKVTCSISKTPIAGGIRLTATKTTDPLKHNLYFKKKATDTYGTTASIDITTTDSGTASAAVGTDTNHLIYETSYDWSTTGSKATKPTITESNIAGGKKYTFANNETSGDIYYSTNGTTWTKGTEYPVKSVTSNVTLYVKVTGVSGKIDSDAATTTINVSAATASISVTNVSGGKKITITNGAGSGTLYYLYSDSTYSNTTDASVNTTINTQISGTAKAYVTGASGYADMSSSSPASSSWKVAKLDKPSGTVTNITNGQKVTFSCTTATYSDGTTETSLSPSFNITADSTSVTKSGATASLVSTTSATSAKVTATASLAGYVTSVSSDEKTLAVTAATVSVTYDSTQTTANAASYTITGTTGGTIQYKIGSGAWTNYSSSVTVNGRQTIYAQIIGIPAKTVPTANATVPYATAPTITASNHNSGGKYFALSNNESTGTINFSVTGGTTQTGTGTSTNSCTNTTKTTCVAWMTGVVGKANGSSTVGKNTADFTLVALAKPTFGSATDTTGGKYVDITAPTKDTTGAAVTTTVTVTSSGGTTNTGTRSTYAPSAAGTATITATAKAPGYATSSNTTSITVTKLNNPTASDAVGIVGGKKITWTAPTKDSDGNTVTGVSLSNSSQEFKTAGTHTSSCTASKIGYVSSSNSTTVTVATATAPTVSISNGTSIGKYFSISSSVGGTINFSVSGGITQTGTGTYTNTCTNTTKTTCVAWITNATGYADGSSTVGTGTNNFTLTPFPTPTLSFVQNISSGKQYKIVGASGVAGVQTSIDNVGWTVRTSGTAFDIYTAFSTLYGKASGPGYAMSEIATLTGNGITTATAPTVSVSNGFSIGKYFSISNNLSTGSINFSVTGGITQTGSGTYTNTCTNTTKTTCIAWVVGASGYADGSSTAGTGTNSFTLTAAATPTLSFVQNITSGKQYKATLGATGATVQTCTDLTSWTSITSGSAFNITNTVFTTLYGRAYGPGLAFSTTATLTNNGVSRATAPTVTASNHDSGGKYFALSSSVGGTINFSVSGGITQTGTGTSTNNCRNTTKTTCTAWITGASGYADSSSSTSGYVGTADFTLTTAAKPASVTATNHSSGGKYFAITNGGQGGTINWAMSGGSTASGTGASSSNWTNTTATSCNAWMTAVPGYADASATVNNTTGGPETLTVATAPTITSTGYLSGTTGGKTFTITNNESTGTIRYYWSEDSSWNNYSSAITKTTVGTFTAAVINVAGKANNSSYPSESLTSVGTPGWNSWTAITNGYYCQCISINVVAGAAISITGVGSNKGPTFGTSGTAKDVITCYATGTPGTYQFRATAYKSGYVTATKDNIAQTIYKLVAPTKPNWTNIAGGKSLTFSAPGTYYSTVGGTSGATAAVTGTTLNVSATSGCSVSGSTVSLTTATSTNQTGSAYVSKSGYVNSATTTSDATTLSTVSTPTITIFKQSKLVQISNPVSSGTMNYSFDNGSTWKTVSISGTFSLPTSSTSSTIKAYITGADGYANASSSVNCDSRDYQVIANISFYDIEPTSLETEEGCFGYYYPGQTTPVLGVYNNSKTSYTATIILDGTKNVTARDSSSLYLSKAVGVEIEGTMSPFLNTGAEQAWWHNDTCIDTSASTSSFSSLTSIKMVSAATSITAYGLSDCTSLTAVYNTGSNITSIGIYAFYGCTSLTTLPSQGSTVTSIGIYAFYGCTSLASFNFNSCTSIGNVAFSHSGITSVSLPTINSMGTNVFGSCTNLASYSQTGGTEESVPIRTCWHCDRLTSITLHTGIKVINAYSFQGCTSIPSIDFTANYGTGLNAIGTCAFQSCTSLASVKFPASLNHDGSSVSLDTSAFSLCSSLSTVDFLALGDNFKNCVIGDSCWTGCVIRTAKITKGNFSAYLRRYTYNNSRLGCRAGGGVFNYWTHANNTRKADTFVLAATGKSSWNNAYYYYSSTRNRTTSYTCYTYGGGNGAACSGDSTSVTNWNAKKYCAIATTCSANSTEDTRVYGMGWDTFNFGFVSNVNTCGYRFTTMGRDVFNGGDYICGNNDTPWNDFSNWYSPSEEFDSSGKVQMAYVNDCLYPNQRTGIGWNNQTFDQLISAGVISSSHTALAGTKLDMMIPIYKNWESVYS